MVFGGMCRRFIEGECGIDGETKSWYRRAMEQEIGFVEGSLIKGPVMSVGQISIDKMNMDEVREASKRAVEEIQEMVKK